MTRMFSMIFVILFFFIMVLCAFQPICFAHAVETGDSLTLSVKLIEFGSNKIYLMLDKDTPLTPRYIRDNPDYKVYISCTGNFGASVDVVVGNSYGSCGVWRGTESNTLYEFSYSNVQQMDYFVNKYSDYLDSPIYITTGTDRPIFTVYASKNYELTLLEKMAIVGDNIFANAQTVITFVAKTPLLLLTFGLSILAFVIAFVRRTITAG